MAENFQPWENPMGTAGFEFIEYTAPDPVALRKGFRTAGLQGHREAPAQGCDAVPSGRGELPHQRRTRFVRPTLRALHGPSICAIGFRVQDANKAYKRALELGAWGSTRIAARWS